MCDTQQQVASLKADDHPPKPYAGQSSWDDIDLSARFEQLEEESTPQINGDDPKSSFYGIDLSEKFASEQSAMDDSAQYKVERALQALGAAGGGGAEDGSVRNIVLVGKLQDDSLREVAKTMAEGGLVKSN